jgi:carbamoyl-phosphate synthase large subunit
MLGHRLKDMGLVGEARIDHVAVKAPVFPFQKLPGVDAILGPEMKSTGEVMGIADTLGHAYYKALVASGNPLPNQGHVYVTVRDEDKEAMIGVVSKLAAAGLTICATRGTATVFREAGIDCVTVYRIAEGKPPDALGMMRSGEIRLVINTPSSSSGARRDGYMMRRLAIDLGIPFITTLQGARAAADAVAASVGDELGVKSLQDYANGNISLESVSRPETPERRVGRTLPS